MIFVGITLHTEDFSELLKKEKPYIDCMKRCGMTPVPIKYTSDPIEVEEKLNKLDGLILIGGGDVHPCHYGRVIEEGIEYMDFNRDRDLCELQLARRAHQLDVPTLGICRGLQIMNVSLGGTLIAEISDDGKDHGGHYQEEPYDRYTHQVHIQPGTRLCKILFGEECSSLPEDDLVIDTNSMHHQALEQPAYGLYINAVGPDGIYEGAEDPSKNFFLGVQWHPEYLSNCFSLFEALRDACTA